MALDFNVGELTTRLRAALGVRGRMPMDLDEHVLPVVLTDVQNVPPWRRNPFRVTVAGVGSTVTVGNFGNIELHFGITDPNAVVVVDSIVLQAVDFVTAGGAPLANARAVANFVPVRNNSILAPASFTTERYPGGVTLAEFQQQFGMRLTDVAVDPSTGTGRIAEVRGAAPLVLPCEIALSGTMAIQFGSVNAATAANTSAVFAAVSGLYYGLGGS